MSESIYAPPVAEVSAPAGTGPRYYVVGTTKFMLLAILTMGMYYVYWMYRNWKQIKLRDNNSSWPVARAIFMIFWTHSLLNDVDAELRREDKSFSWNPNIVATAFVALALFASFAGQVTQYVYNTILPPMGLQIVLTLIPILYAFVLRRGQQAMNLASGDENGESNSKLTVANWLWMLFGAVLWAATVFGLYVVYSMGL